MISLTRPAFWKLYYALSDRAREQARKAYRMFEGNPDHPALNFKKLRGVGDFWAVRVGDQYRAVGVRSSDTITWLWIGTHNEYDKLF